MSFHSANDVAMLEFKVVQNVKTPFLGWGGGREGRKTLEWVEGELTG